MIGTGRIEGDDRLVIPSPIYTCDDGSEAVALSGPPLQEQLRNLTYVHRPPDRRPHRRPRVGLDTGPWAGAERRADDLGDHVAPVEPRRRPPGPGARRRRRPRLHVAGRSAAVFLRRRHAAEYPLGADIFERFVREELGWEEFSGFAIMGYVENGGHDRGRRVHPLRAWPDEPAVPKGLPGHALRGPRVRADARRLPVRDGEVQRGPAERAAALPGSGS